MWLFCRSGFFSAVLNYERDDTIHVRARFEGDLERLLESHGIEGIPISHTPGNDYPYRADIPTETWSIICLEEAKDIDYINFKNAVHDGTNRDKAYMDVWKTLRQSQQP